MVDMLKKHSLKTWKENLKTSPKINQNNYALYSSASDPHHCLLQLKTKHAVSISHLNHYVPLKKYECTDWTEANHKSLCPTWQNVCVFPHKHIMYTQAVGRQWFKMEKWYCWAFCFSFGLLYTQMKSPGGWEKEMRKERVGVGGVGGVAECRWKN